ncbi:MAG: hypothetical protein M1840_005087 [Geoglossum simile]|nr:MAG: hypothetical protein M1840_005087 [Geoglossum simile]
MPYKLVFWSHKEVNIPETIEEEENGDVEQTHSESMARSQVPSISTPSASNNPEALATVSEGQMTDVNLARYYCGMAELRTRNPEVPATAREGQMTNVDYYRMAEHHYGKAKKTDTLQLNDLEKRLSALSNEMDIGRQAMVGTDN